MGLLKKKHEKRSKPTIKGILTAILATKAAIFLLILAGLSLSGTAVAFIATMPLFVVFSPVLVPAGVTTGLLFTGLAAGGGAGLSALSIISWLYKKLTVKELPKTPGLTLATGSERDVAQVTSLADKSYASEMEWKHASHNDAIEKALGKPNPNLR